MKDTTVKVSIVIPVYNSELFLEDCLSSVLAQTLKEIEVIVVDDGSKDKSWSLIQRIAAKDGRVVPIHQANQGVSIARNTGVRAAKGEYVGFVDSDDTVDEGYFEGMYRTAVAEGSDIVTGYVKMDNERRQHFYNYTNKQSVRHNKNSLVGVVWLNIYRNSLLKQHDVHFPPNLQTAEDNYFNLQASYHAAKVCRSHDDTSFYHQAERDGSLTTRQVSGYSLLQLYTAVLETVLLLNTLDRYDKDSYVLRVMDTFNYFYQRYAVAERVDILTRYKVNVISVRIWKNLKYRPDIVAAAQEKELDLRVVFKGVLTRRPYETQVIKLKGEKKKKSERNWKMSDAKTLAKRTLKALLPYAVVRRYEQRHELRPDNAPLNPRKIAVLSAYDVVYTDLLKKAIEAAGYEVTSRASDAKYVWLHWYENGIADYTKLYGKIQTLWRMRQQGRKVIFHIHNKKPHEAKLPNAAHALMTLLADGTDHVSIMSDETKGLLKDMWYNGEDFSSVSLVPHPHYINAYGKKLEQGPEDNGTLKILFFGQVRPYKGVEHLLKATEGMENVQVGVYGVPKDDDYIATLRSMCKNRTNVTFRLEHIPDKDIPKIFAAHHIVALPYSIESSLNSGAAILALSYARTIVGTNNGTLKQFGDKNLYFGYDYTDEKDHIQKLREAISSIQDAYGDDYGKLLEVGQAAYERVKIENGIDAVSKAIRDMIERIG